MEGDADSVDCHPSLIYFNPLPPHGGRRQRQLISSEGIPFQSTPSAWRETIFEIGGIFYEIISIHSLRMEGDPPFFIIFLPYPLFQSTPSAWRETIAAPYTYHGIAISIHSLRMEGDRFRQIQLPPQCHFNPLPPHGGRLKDTSELPDDLVFQSTPSAWRETTSGNPGNMEVEISIHSLRMEGD